MAGLLTRRERSSGKDFFRNAEDGDRILAITRSKWERWSTIDENKFRHNVKLECEPGEIATNDEKSKIVGSGSSVYRVVTYNTLSMICRKLEEIND